MTTHADPLSESPGKTPCRRSPTRCVCEACPVLCQISPGKLGACDRYGNVAGALDRVVPVLLLARSWSSRAPVVLRWRAWDGALTSPMRRSS